MGLPCSACSCVHIQRIRIPTKVCKASNSMYQSVYNPELAICKLAAHLVCYVRALAKHSQHSLSKLSTLTTYSTHKGMHIIPPGLTPTGTRSKRFKIAASTLSQSTRSLIEGDERADESQRHSSDTAQRYCTNVVSMHDTK